MKTCPFCKGDIEIRNINHMHKWADEFYLFKNIKAEVCNQCGEVFFLPETLKLIDKYVTEKKTFKKTICIPVMKCPHSLFQYDENVEIGLVFLQSRVKSCFFAI